jgi:integrase
MGLYIEDRKRAGTVNVKRIEEVRRSLAPVWGDLYPEDLDKTIQRRFIERGARKGHSTATTRQVLSYLQAALNFAVAAKLIPSAPKLAKPPPPRPRDQYLTREDAQRLLDACDAFHIRLFISLSIATAARPKHLLELTWDRVDFKTRIINLDNPAKDRTAKGRARVPINAMALEILATARDAAETDHVIEWVGKPVKNVKRGIAAASRRSGVPATPYIFRRTAGVWMAQAGVPMSEICEYMGHTSINTTIKHYAKYGPEHLRKASGALDLSGSRGGSCTPQSGNDSGP